MKKLLIASTALVAAAGMASADITITGHAAAGIYSGLSNKDGKAKTKTATSHTKLVYIDVDGSTSGASAGDLIVAGSVTGKQTNTGDYE